MANELDETTGPVREEGRDVNVIEKQLPVKVGPGSTAFQVILWVLGIIPGLVFLFMKINAKTYLRQLQQKIQHHASEIDNVLEERVVVLTNTASLLNKSIELDKDVMKSVAALRSGTPTGDEGRVMTAETLAKAEKMINVAFEKYPELRAHEDIQTCMSQNSILQREITAARSLYNDAVAEWNTAIFAWPTKMIAAAECGYTTRIPFSVSKETKEAARSNFFN